MEKERRKFKRIKAAFPIKMLENDSVSRKGTSWRSGVTTDVSVKGALVQYGGRKEFTVGGRLRIRLLIPQKYTEGFTDMTLNGKGRIVRVARKNRKTFLGVEFDSSLKFGNFF